MRVNELVCWIATLACAVSSVRGQSSTLHFTVSGVAAGDECGWSVATAGDVNGDGVADVVVGAWHADPAGLQDSGAAYVRSGQNGAVLFNLAGSAPGDEFGFVVASAGDVDGDLRADLLVGAPQATANGLVHAGKVYLFSGATGALLHTWNGLGANDQFGWSVASAGKVDGDAVPDVIIGAKAATVGSMANAGRAYIYSGATFALIRQLNGASAGDEFGFAVAGNFDWDSDNYADVLVSAAKSLSERGRAYLFSGVSGAVLRQWNGTASKDQFGFAVSNAGDVDGDGHPDVVIGARQPDDPSLPSRHGYVGVYSGTSGLSIYQWTGSTLGGEFGFSARGAGDVDADGRADVIVGERYANSGAGRAVVFRGSNGLPVLGLGFDGAAAGDELGFSVAGVGDLNGDGRSDVIIGARGVDAGPASSIGRAYVYFAPTVAPFDLLAATAGSGVGNLSLNVTSIPAAATNVILLASTLTPPGGLGTGAAFGLSPDGLFLTMITFPLTPGFFLHFPVSANPYATGPVTFPPGTFSALTGTGLDLTAVCYSLSAGVVGQAGVHHLIW